MFTFRFLVLFFFPFVTVSTPVLGQYAHVRDKDHVTVVQIQRIVHAAVPTGCTGPADFSRHDVQSGDFQSGAVVCMNVARPGVSVTPEVDVVGLDDDIGDPVLCQLINSGLGDSKRLMEFECGESSFQHNVVVGLLFQLAHLWPSERCSGGRGYIKEKNRNVFLSFYSTFISSIRMSAFRPSARSSHHWAKR